MIKFTLYRTKTSDQGTFGLFVSNDMRFFAYAAELPWRQNQSDKSHILAGTYTAQMQYSPSKGQPLYRLNDKQTYPRTAILIEPANWAGDTSKGYKSDLLGCIALGNGYTDNLDGQEAVTNSQAAIARLHLYTQGQAIQITIKDITEHNHG